MIASFLIFIFAVTLFFFVVINSKINQPERIVCVDAGPVANVNPQVLLEKTKFEPMGVFRTPDGRLLTSEHYQRITVCGTCMVPKGIQSGQTLIVEKIKEGQQQAIKQEDILLIYVPDKQIYKIRVCAGEEADDRYATYYFDESEQRKDSSNPHRKQDVKGIVRYILPG